MNPESTQRVKRTVQYLIINTKIYDAFVIVSTSDKICSKITLLFWIPCIITSVIPTYILIFKIPCIKYINKASMALKIVHVMLRGTILIALLLSFLLHSEGDGLSYFIGRGVLGSFCVVTLGLLLEAGLNKKSDKLVEVVLLLSAVLLLSVTSLLLFSEFVDSLHETTQMTKGGLSTLCTVLYIVDLMLLRV